VDIWAAAFTARPFSIAEVSIKASAMEGSETLGAAVSLVEVFGAPHTPTR
jgi:hypothetical protein